MLIDADRHIHVSLPDLIPFLDQPWRHRAENAPAPKFILPRQVGDLTVGGRIRRPAPDAGEEDPVRADGSVVFPSELMGIGLHPDPFFEAAIAKAYARWLVEAFLPGRPMMQAMLYLPIRDPRTCSRLIREFGQHAQVAGGFITSAGYPELHAGEHLKLYAEMEERGLPLGFHPTSVWLEKPFTVFDRYLPVYAVGLPFHQCVQVINWVLHGLPERFPRLRCIFYEAGITWLSFLAHRLDQEFLKRPSEAPLLKDRPSRYMARYYYTTHPLERAGPAYLESVVRLFGPEQFLYASNYPEWDFDLPSVVRELSFLTEEERQGICGGNAARVHSGLDARSVGA